MHLSLPDIKRHLNVDFEEDDTLITSMIEVAESAIEKTIGSPLSDYEKDGVLPTTLVHCIRLMTARLYEYREGDTFGKTQEVPFTIGFLLAPFVKLS